MSAPSLDVLAIQLRQIQSQLEQLMDTSTTGPLWTIKGIDSFDRGSIAARLDDAKHAVSMARIRAENIAAAQQEPLAVCPSDSKRDPKPDSGDDPRWQGPEYDKYEADERRGA